MKNATKFLCEMNGAELIAAHTADLKAQRALLARAGEHASTVERWIKETEAALERLRG